MNHRELIVKLQANYRNLRDLYRSADFEEEIETALDATENQFFLVLPEMIEPQLSLSKNENIALQVRGKRRSDRDLEWAARESDKYVRALFAIHLDPLGNRNSKVELEIQEKRELALLHLRTTTLCYEVEDYFLSVSRAKSRRFIEVSEEIVDNFDSYFAKYYGTLQFQDGEKAEAVKYLLITALLGANECYREQDGRGLKITDKISDFIGEKYVSLTHDPATGLGLKGLRHYIAGKIESYQSKFVTAEDHFRRSVEAYSESIWRKEEEYKKHRQGCATEKDKERVKRDYQLSRQVTLRRCALAQSFGIGFQSLVLGNIREAIRTTALARAVVYGNAGEIYSAYVNLIYYSAKRAEYSSNHDTLIDVERGIEECLQVFNDLIPAAHYKNRAVFQLALVRHYLARWWQKNESKAECYQKAKSYWDSTIKILSHSIAELKEMENTKLLAESLSILSHAQCNLALLEQEHDSSTTNTALLDEAQANAEAARSVAKNTISVQCESGLALAAVQQTRSRFLAVLARKKHNERGTLYIADKPSGDRISELITEARSTLLDVLRINNNQEARNVRIEATVYLRMVELALMYGSTRHLAQAHYQNFLRIKDRTEHDFLHQWSRKLSEELKYVETNFVAEFNPEKKVYSGSLLKNLEIHIAQAAINRVAIEIERETVGETKISRSCLNARLKKMLVSQFDVPDGSAQKQWIERYEMIKELKDICPPARKIQEGKSDANKSSR